MDKFDRLLQREMLTILINAYPGSPNDFDYDPGIIDDVDHFKLAANLIYLAQHQLIQIVMPKSELEPEDWRWMFDSAKATCKGVDFMLNDGGLTAILNIQTFNIHRDTITALEDIISLSNLPEPEKAGIVSKLQQLPSTAIEHLTKELLVKGALNLPAALPLIQKFLFGG